MNRFAPVLALALAAGAVPLTAARAAPPAAPPPGSVAALMTPAPQSPSPSTPVLTPLPAPGQPVVSGLTATGATLTWERPAGPVFRYSMQRLVDGAWQGWVSMPGPTFTFSALTPGTTYTVRVFAAALVGTGYTTSPPSEPVSFTTPSEPALRCRLVVRSWAGGFMINGTITNASTGPVLGWALGFTLGATARITGAWNANVTMTGSRVTVRSSPWTSGIDPAGSQTFGLIGSHTGAFEPPRDITLNGQPGGCEVIVG
ncbi:MAG TPA: cellulose binding domain-containing protein [Pilimelia sp.]|nr:cellulose binding domain-containing protein [Pilimelia sp.]